MMMMAAAGEGGGCEMEGEVVGDGAGEQRAWGAIPTLVIVVVVMAAVHASSLMVVLGLGEGGVWSSCCCSINTFAALRTGNSPTFSIPHRGETGWEGAIACCRAFVEGWAHAKTGPRPYQTSVDFQAKEILDGYPLSTLPPCIPWPAELQGQGVLLLYRLGSCNTLSGETFRGLNLAVYISAHTYPPLCMLLSLCDNQSSNPLGEK